MTTLLVDADGVAFKAASAVQRSILWDDDIFTTHADFDEAKDAFEQLLDRYVRVVDDADAKVVLCYSCPTRHYFRHDLLDTYKGNRKSSAPPLALRDLKAWSSEKWETKTKPNLEADDVLGILATHPKLIKGPKIIVSMDKDLRQIPGLHIDANDPDLGVFRVAEDFAERFLWTQVLTGDQTDGYTGCPGIGPVKAKGILSGVKGEAQFAAAVWGAYDRAGLSQEEMAVQVNVARILKADNYDFKRKEPKLWSM